MAELDWGVADHRNLVARKTTPHVVVASDVVYEEQNIGAHCSLVIGLKDRPALSLPRQNNNRQYMHRLYNVELMKCVVQVSSNELVVRIAVFA